MTTYGWTDALDGCDDELADWDDATTWTDDDRNIDTANAAEHTGIDGQENAT